MGTKFWKFYLGICSFFFLITFVLTILIDEEFAGTAGTFMFAVILGVIGLFLSKTNERHRG